MIDQSKSHSPAKPSAKASKERFLILALMGLTAILGVYVSIPRKTNTLAVTEPTATELAIRDLKSSLNMPAFSC